MDSTKFSKDMQDIVLSTAAASDYNPHIFDLRQSTWIKTRSADAGIKQGLMSLGHGLTRAAFTLACTRILGGPESPCSDGLHGVTSFWRLRSHFVQYPPQLLYRCCTADTVIREILQKQRFRNLQMTHKDLAKASKLRDQLFMFVAGIWLQTFSFKTICEWIDGVFDPLISAAVVKFNEQPSSQPQQQSGLDTGELLLSDEFPLLEALHSFQTHKAVLQLADSGRQVPDAALAALNPVQTTVVLAKNHADDVHEYFATYEYEIANTDTGSEETFTVHEYFATYDYGVVHTDTAAVELFSAPADAPQADDSQAAPVLLPPVIIEMPTQSPLAEVTANATFDPVQDVVDVAASPSDAAVKDPLLRVRETIKDPSPFVEETAMNPSPPAEAAIKNGSLTTNTKCTPPSSPRRTPLTPRNVGDYRWPSPLQHNLPSPYIPSPLRTHRSSPPFNTSS